MSEKLEYVWQLRSKLADHDMWRGSDKDALLQLLFEGILYYGQTCDGSVISQVGELYDHVVNVTDDDDRRRFYFEIQQRVCKLSSPYSPNTFFPFIFRESHGGIVATAILDHAMCYPTKNAEDLDGVRYLVDILTQAQFTNRGAVFGGLIALGDARTMHLLDDVKWTLDPEQITAAATSGTQSPGLACIEFWLHWLEEIAESGNSETQHYGRCCLGLAKMGHLALSGNVIEINRNFGYTCRPGEEPSSLRRPVGIQEIHKLFAARMYDLEDAELPPKVMSYVLEAYGLEPRALPSERYDPKLELQ